MIGPLLANIYLDPLDAFIAERGYRMARYAGDFVILCQTREEAEAALADVRAWVTMNGLALHPQKMHVGDCRQPGQGFEFLGYRFEAGERHVRKKSLTELKDSIRVKTKRTRGDSLVRIVAGLNRMLRGWFSYFNHAHPKTFESLDGRALLRSRRAWKSVVPIITAGQMPSSRRNRSVCASHGLAVGETVSMIETPLSVAA